MLIIPIKDGENIDKALKRFKRKFDKTGVMRSLRDRKQFVKPSIEHRAKILKARYVQKLKEQPCVYFPVLSEIFSIFIFFVYY